MLFRSDRKSTRLNSSHLVISYAVFCLKKKKDDNQNAIGKLENRERSAIGADCLLERQHPLRFFFFFFNDTATTEIYPLSLHDALPICRRLLAHHVKVHTVEARRSKP